MNCTAHENTQQILSVRRCVRFAVRCVGRSMEENLLQSIAQTITRTYAKYQHSCFLYLGSVLVSEYLKGNKIRAEF